MIPRYPKALWIGDGQSGGSYTSGPYKVVLHTTETRGIPGYNDGRYAPHMTYSPRSRTFYQHTEFTVAARALKNGAGGVQTNRDSALQLEIICYSNKSMAERVNGLPVNRLSHDNLDDIRDFILWTGVDLSWPGRKALSYGQANATGFRLSGPAWDNYSAVCGHQHVPENTHWDPGDFDWDYLIGGGDDLALTPYEQEQLARFLKELDDVNSNVSFVRYLIPWYRKWRSFLPTNFLKRGDNVKLS